MENKKCICILREQLSELLACLKHFPETQHLVPELDIALQEHYANNTPPQQIRDYVETFLGNNSDVVYAMTEIMEGMIRDRDNT